MQTSVDECSTEYTVASKKLLEIEFKFPIYLSISYFNLLSTFPHGIR